MKRANITDRAKRYRAQKKVRGARKCVICGGKRNLGVMHLSGNEDDGEPENLAWGCKSCNGVLGSAFASIGAGRPTNQYNPAGKKPPTYEQYLWAVTHHSPGAFDEGGAVIHATPKRLRIDYAKRIAGFKAGRARARDDERWNPKRGNPRNPADESAAAYERFHGAPSLEVLEVEERVHLHDHLAALGVLKRLVVKAPDGEKVKLEGFKGAVLAGNEGDSQLFIRGGDQSIDLEAFGIEEPFREFEDLGEVWEIRYHTTKKHLGKDGGTADYFHFFGEDDKDAGRRPRRPRLVYDRRSALLSFAGGGYVITPEGIKN